MAQSSTFGTTGTATAQDGRPAAAEDRTSAGPDPAADRRFRLVVAGAAVIVVTVVAVVGSGVLPPHVALMVDDAAQFTAAVAATAGCWWAASRRQGTERRWRLLMGVGMAGWTAGMALWGWYRSFAGIPLPSPSWADIGFLALPVFAFPALLAFASGGVGRAKGRGATGTRLRTQTMLLLDGFVVAGSLFVLTWSTTLGAVVAAGAPNPMTFALAIAYPITDLVLVTVVVLIASFRSVEQPRQLLLLGLGLVALAASDGIFAYVMISGAEAMHLVADAGFIAGPTLVFLAALASDPGTARARESDRQGIAGWIHLMLPYLPVLIAGVIIVARAFSGDPLDNVEGTAVFAVLVLVVVRQLLTLIDNTALLDRVHQTQQRLAYQVSHDPLTGLANNTLFEEQLHDAIALHRESGHPFALLYIDLDDFKAINDEFGHGAGDALLQAVAARLRHCVSAADLVARLGGDEFAILLAGGREVSEPVKKRVTTALGRPFAIAGHLQDVHASLGAVTTASGGAVASPQAMLGQADAAMYTAKRRHKRSLQQAPGILAGRAKDADLQMQLATALRPEAGWPGLDVHYQPIVRIADHRLVAVEALARWTSPTHGVVAPDAFVALAEQGGLISALDNFVLDRACGEIKALGTRHSPPLTLHVNVSACRLSDPELVDFIDAALQRHGIPGNRVVLEITETSDIPDFDVAAEIIDQLRGLDLRFALDDFGTGYNTLAHLHRFPVDMVKLDQTFTTFGDSPDPTHTDALRRSIVSIARALDVVIVIEGVETESQDKDLGRQGYDLAQGYLYGRPTPLDQLPGCAAPSAGR